MDFTFSPEQDALRDGRSLVPRRRGPVDLRAGHARRRRRASPTTSGPRPSQLGWPGLLIPEAARRRRARPARRGGPVRGDGRPPAPRAVVLLGGVRHARWRAASATWTCSPGWRAGPLRRRSPSRRPARAIRSTASRCTARRRGDDWCSHGLSRSCSTAHTADLAYVVARRTATAWPRSRSTDRGASSCRRSTSPAR